MSMWHIQTPHPRFSHGFGQGSFLVMDGETMVCEQAHASTTGQSARESVARGNLISTAPELLKALNYAVISLETCLDYVDTRQIQGAIDAYRVVIAKANGDGNGEDGNE